LAVQVRQQRRQAGLVLQPVDAVELGFEDGDTFLVDGIFIDAGGVVVADLLLVRRAIGGFAGVLQNAAKYQTVALRQLAQPAPDPLVGRDRVVLFPSTAGELIEVHAGISALVQGGDLGVGVVCSLGDGAGGGESGKQQGCDRESHKYTHIDFSLNKILSKSPQ